VCVRERENIREYVSVCVLERDSLCVKRKIEKQRVCDC